MTQLDTHRPALGAFGLVAGSLRLFIARFGLLFPLAFAPSLALSALILLIVGGDALNDPMGAAKLGFGAAPLILGSVVFNALVTGVMCLASLDAALGKRHTLGEYLRQALRHLGPLVGLGLLVALAIAAGTALFLVPGFYIIARYLPWTPAAVFENAGWSGLGRGQELTQGYRWPLAGAVAMMGVILVAMILASGPVLDAVGMGGIAGILIDSAVSAVYYALTAAFTALVYLRLREIKDGMSVADVAASIE